MRRLSVLAALLLAAAACASPAARPVRPAGQASPDGASPSPEPSPKSSQAAMGAGDDSAGVAVPEELRFEAPLLSGGTVRGADYAGADLVIWLWAPW